MSGQSLSLIMPAFNEGAVIETAVREGVEALRSLDIEFEMLVVDDGSTDRTGEIAHRLAAEFVEVQVIQHEHNRGYGAALRTGFGCATKSLIGFTDADCQFDLRELDRLLLIARDHDAACGYRTERQDSLQRCLYSAIYNLLVRTLLGTRVRDCDCALKVFRRDALAAFTIQSDGFFVNAEILFYVAQLNGPAYSVKWIHYLERKKSGVSLRCRCGFLGFSFQVAS